MSVPKVCYWEGVRLEWCMRVWVWVLVWVSREWLVGGWLGECIWVCPLRSIVVARILGRGAG